ncbi:thioredoxin family protein [Candidatus Solincola tengchongensis]|uniref:thioredoxin family protein n=1 Tax=Candidatus Solincola tengchongensis TaxID=2900693 RepID=UPI002579E937|nr:thioredoxin family protein [Candidatus Solincola tengchongensis]
MADFYEKSFLKARRSGGEEKKKEGSRAGKILIVSLAVLASLAFLFLADCGCGEQSGHKEEMRAEVEQEEQELKGNSSQSLQTTASPSQKAIESALQAGRPVFLNFHSNQCIPCKEMEKAIEEVRPEYEGRVAFVVVDVYDPAEMVLCDRFQVRVIPTSFFIRPDGTVVDAYEGLLRAPELRNMLNRLLAGQA